MFQQIHATPGRRPFLGSRSVRAHYQVLHYASGQTSRLVSIFPPGCELDKAKSGRFHALNPRIARPEGSKLDMSQRRLCKEFLVG
jgi:hypothetical protein